MLRYGECMTCALPRWGGGARWVCNQHHQLPVQEQHHLKAHAAMS